MPDSPNKAVFEIPSNLRMLNSLPLQDTLRIFLVRLQKAPLYCSMLLAMG